MRIGGASVLVVEDQPIIAMAISDMLEEFGATVVGPATTLTDALHLASSERFDLALLDVWLNGIVAFPVGDVLRHRDIPFIVLSGGTSDSQEPQSFRAAARLLKPVREGELRAAIERL